MSLSAGSRLGPYEIVASLGAGGMGEVYRAKDTRLDREVAVKVLPEGFAANEQFRARFEREAKSISSLNHPNICTLHDVGRQDGLMFLVMERIEGESLADRLAKGPLPLDQVLRYGAEIAAGLDAAHRRGIIHRDLKPGNVMLTRTGAKLLDFGLAKTGSESPSPIDGLTSLPTEQRPLTQEGTILGTFQYMSPEQLEGVETDARSDLFALGAVLYEMATGKRAFQGKNKTSLIAAIVSSQPPPISSVQPVSPPALDHVVRKCLEKDPEDRWQSAHDVATQLRWISEAGSQAGVSAPLGMKRRSRERLAWVLAGVGAALALGAVAVHWMEPQQESRPIVASILPPEKLEFQLQEGDAGSLTISPDGKLVTFLAKGEDGKRVLHVRRLDTGEVHPIAGSEDAVFPFWSPDSDFLAFFAGDKLMKADVLGGPPLPLCSVGENPRRGSWSRDDVIIFSPSSLDAIFRISASGGKPAPVTKLDVAKAETTHRWATFLPDGRHFLYMAGTHAAGAANEANAVYVGDLETGASKLVLHARSNVEFADGRLLYVRDNILLAQPFDLGRLEASGNPVPVVDRVQYASGYFYAAFAVSAGGDLVYLPSADVVGLTAEWVDRQGKTLGQVTGFPPQAAAGTGGALSPDGGSLAVSLQDPSTGRNDIWILDLRRNVANRLTFDAGDENSPCWSPDGKKLIYARLDGSYLNLFAKAASGEGAEEEILKSETHKIPSDWSKEGRLVAVDQFDPSTQLQRDIGILRMDGSRKLEPFLISPFSERNPKFSPDGRWIAYWSNESGADALYVAAFPGLGTRYQIASGAVGEPVSEWSPDGRELYYVGGDAAMKVVELTPRGSVLEIGTPRSLFKVPPLNFWLPDRGGKRFLLARSAESYQSAPIALVTDWTRRLRR